MHIAYLPLEQLRIGARTPVISPSYQAISRQHCVLCMNHKKNRGGNIQGNGNQETEHEERDVQSHGNVEGNRAQAAAADS
jgi:hypothetical protein